MTKKIIDALGMFAFAVLFAGLFAVLGAFSYQTGQIFTACMCGLLGLATVATGATLAFDIVRG